MRLPAGMRALAVALAALWARPGVAAACSVCYGAAEGDMIDGARTAIVFMLVLTYVLLGGGLGMVWIARRRIGAASASGETPGAPTAQPSPEETGTRKDDRE
jgi:hypothetical protein